MAIFIDTGGGDIYAGPTKEAVIAAILADAPDLADKQGCFFKVRGSQKMRTARGNTGYEVLTTIAKEYEFVSARWGGRGFCIASDNC